MKVYRIDTDIDNYQYFFTKNETDAMKLLTDCKSQASNWEPPSVFIYEPLHKAGDFFSFSSCSLIFSPEAVTKLHTHLEIAGELLPLPFENNIYILLNVTECINCLEREHSEWRTDEKIGMPTKYTFHPNRFAETTIFKIPETYKSEILVLDREDGSEGFVQALKMHKIEGYELKLLWSA